MVQEALKNVLLVSIDCLRPEALGCYLERFPLRVSFPRGPRTPNIDRLAADGHRFDQAITQAPFTPAAHASLLTGLIPPRHGIRTILGSRLCRGVTTLAEVLSTEGWHCGAVVGSGALDREFGLSRGFSHYDDDIQTGISAWLLGQRRDASDVTDRALAWLESNRYERFFLFVHYFDAHDVDVQPSHDHAPDSDIHGSSWFTDLRRILPKPIKWAIRSGLRMIRSTAGYFELGSAYAGYGHRFMLGEVARVDSQIGRIIKALSSCGRLNKTLIILVADHGDSFMQHGERSHRMYLYDTTLRVPLIIYPRLGVRSVVTDQVRIVDVLPTVLEVLGLSAGEVDIDGLSLISLLQGSLDSDRGELPRRAYAETVMESATPHAAQVATCLACLRVPPWKLIWDRLRNCSELYDVVEDPGELRNLSDMNPHLVATLSEELLCLAKEMPVSEQEPDHRLVERLRGLGYL